MIDDFDVIIAGGGISGSIAAIAASRYGAHTLLIEKYGFSGGMLTAAGVGPMMSFHAGENQIIRGITSELIDRMVLKGKSAGHIPDTVGFTYTVTPFNAEYMKYELDNMLQEAGCNILYHTVVTGAHTENGTISSINIHNKSGFSRLSSKIYIDATGDGDLSSYAGVVCNVGRDSDGMCQPMTMNIKMRGVNLDAVREYMKINIDEFPYLKGNAAIIDKSPRLSVGGLHKFIKNEIEKGEISFKCTCVLFFETDVIGEVIVNMTKILGKNPLNPWELSKAEIEGRKQAHEVADFLKRKMPGFENANMVYTGPSIGVRSSRQIKGIYTLTQDDLISSKKFYDVIAHSGYPIDIHNPEGNGVESLHPDWGKIYSIPYKCLVNDRVNNLITVGRCISATFEAQAAIRTTPTAGAIGHAGGLAASIAAARGSSVHDVNVKELQENLLKQGAYLEL